MVTPQTTGALVLNALRPYDLKAEPNGRYRCNSPFRPGSNSHALSVTLKPDGEHGAWYDFVTNEGGSLYDLATRLGIENAKPTAEASSKRTYAGLADYAAEHGVATEVFLEARWSETTHQGRPALAFPTATGTRYRFLDGAKPAYMSPSGYQSCWYGLERAARLAREASRPLVLCNGEAATVVAQHYGIPAACVTGSGEKPIPAGLLAELQQAYRGAIIVALDCDDKGRQAAPRLVDQLSQAGYSARAVDLNLSYGDDLADYCHLYGDEAAASLVSARGLAEPPRHWLTEEELEHLPKPAALAGTPLWERTIAIVYGPSGVGKTFYTIDLAMTASIETGKPVLYVAAEDVEGVRLRKNAWRELHGETRGQLLVWPEEINLLDAGQVANLIAEVRDLGLAAVVFDTFAQCTIGADENSGKDMGIAADALKQVLRASGATVIAIHHTNASGARERGHSALRAAAYTMIELTDEDGVVKVSCTKAKNSAPFDPYLLKLVEVEESAVMVPAGRVLDTDTLTQNQVKVLDFLKLDIYEDTGATSSQLEASGVNDKTLPRVLSHLKRKGFIRQSAKGSPYHITPAGLTALRKTKLHGV